MSCNPLGVWKNTAILSNYLFVNNIKCLSDLWGLLCLYAQLTQCTQSLKQPLNMKRCNVKSRHDYTLQHNMDKWPCGLTQNDGLKCIYVLAALKH